MDEGVGNYIYYTSYRNSATGTEVETWHRAQLAIARDALASGKWLKIMNITYMYDWNLAESTSPGLAPAESYAVICYLAEKYGLEKCISTYRAVSHNGGSAESGMSSTMGLTFEQLESGVADWLLAQPV